MARVAIVFGAGGLPGEAYHRGVVRALADVVALDPRHADLVVGTSAGSLMAATVRAPGTRPDAIDLEPLVTTPAFLPDVRGFALAAVRPWRLRTSTFTAALLPAGPRSTDVISDGVRRRHGAAWPRADTWIVAVRRCDGRRVVFGRPGSPDTDIGAAVAASCAIPVVFSPVVIGGRAYVDGGVHSHTNADLVVQAACDIVVVSAPMSVAGVRGHSLDMPMRLFWRHQLHRELVPVRRSGAAVVVLEPPPALVTLLGFNPLQAGRLDEIEDLTYRLVCTQLRRSALAA